MAMQFGTAGTTRACGMEDTLKRLSMMAANRPAAAPSTRLATNSVRNLPKMVPMVPRFSTGTAPMCCAPQQHARLSDPRYETLR